MRAHLHTVVEMSAHHHLMICPFGLACLDQCPCSQLLIQAYLKAELKEREGREEVEEEEEEEEERDIIIK